MQLVGKFWENLRKFSKNFLRKFRKMNSFSIFFKRFNKPCVNFSRVWTKNTTCWKFWENFENFWWEFYRKLIFIFILENLLLKIEPSEITPFFYNIFSVSGDSPWLRPLIWMYRISRHNVVLCRKIETFYFSKCIGILLVTDADANADEYADADCGCGLSIN